MSQSNLISIVVPICEKPRRYLELFPNLLESIYNQTIPPTELIVVCDGMLPILLPNIHIEHLIVEIPARVGVPNAFNCGVAVASEELVLMVGADDVLKPNCIETCITSYTGQSGFYWLPIEWEDGTVYGYPCGHAMVTKEFWNRIDGYPLEAPGACDAALISMIWDTPDLIPINGPPLVTVCRSPDTYTGSRDPRWVDIILRTRELLTILYREKLNLPETIGAPRTL